VPISGVDLPDNPILAGAVLIVAFVTAVAPLATGWITNRVTTTRPDPARDSAALLRQLIDGLQRHAEAADAAAELARQRHHADIAALTAQLDHAHGELAALRAQLKRR